MNDDDSPPPEPLAAAAGVGSHSRLDDIILKFVDIDLAKASRI
jgi:hypothetical protein